MRSFYFEIVDMLEYFESLGIKQHSNSIRNYELGKKLIYNTFTDTKKRIKAEEVLKDWLNLYKEN